MTDSNGRDGAAVRLPPPLVYVAALGIGALLQAFVLALPLPLGGRPRIAATAVAALAGAGLVGAALGLFRRTGQDPKPWESTPEIISSGVYRWTRNPMYVGMALLQLAFGFGLANGWIVAFVPVSLAIVFATAVRHEEAYLERKFGSVYLDYKRSVRRWL